MSGVDEEVRIDKIIYRGNLDYGQRGRVVFSIGSEKLTLQDDNPVQVGSDEDEVDGTNVVINDGLSGNSGGADLSKLEVQVAGPDDENSFIQAGEQFEDPVFETFSFAFGGMSPAEDADSRSEIEQGIDGEDFGTLTVTDGDNSATLNVAEVDGSGNIVDYTDDYEWNVVEGAELAEDDRFIVDSGDFTHVLSVDGIPNDGDGEVQFEDALSGTTYTASLDSGDGNVYIDGQEYHVHRDGNDDLHVTWGTGADYDNAGDETTVYAAMHDANDAEVAMTTDVDAAMSIDATGSTGTGLDAGSDLTLPTGTVDVTFDEDTANQVNDVYVDGTDVTSGAAVTVGQVDYYFSVSGAASATATLDVGLEDPDTAGQEIAEPIPLVIEEEDEDDSEQNAFMLTFTTNNDDEIEVESPTYTNTGKWSGAGTLDNDDSIYLTQYGTYAVEDDDSESVTLHYPDNQATVGAGFVGENGELTTSGGGESVTYRAMTGQGSLPDMARLDSEVTETTKSENHLILVGGPAVNTLVSDLVDSGDVDLSQLEGQSSGALLQTVDDAFANGQHALVVAGVGAEDTREAARYISNYDAHSEALEEEGSSMVLTEAQYMG